ncbi:glycosyltransferase family 2 protein [Polaromonas sp. YR568]|uniref:glycosyltransferase family 2 protein n=1 Tax=Polaromonas sp. YR568 TaxID=1855301 RepID=UPI00398C0BDD
MNTPICSICIANYNGMEMIDDCLRSVMAQKGQFMIEILVHDDASTDDSVAYIRDRYPGARLIVSESNVGFCAANNRMAAEARGEYLLLLNNDAALYPDALLTLLSETTRLDQPAVLSLAQYDFDSGELLDIGSLFDPFLNPIPNQNPDRGEVGMVMGACLWIPKALWQELDGFPEWFESIGEDLQLCCRARLAGYPVRALGQSGYRHRVGASFGGGKAMAGRLVTSYRRRALSERNKTFVMILCYPFWLLVVVLPLHLSILCIEGIVLSALKWSPRPWREIYVPLPAALWRARKKLLTLRGEIQEKRNSGTAFFLRPFHWLPWKLKMLFKHGLPVIR